MKKAIITGVNGQDGSYLSRFLMKKNYEVVGFIRDTTKVNLSNHILLGIQDQVKLKRINLLNRAKLRDFIIDIKPDEIYHLASQSSVYNSFQNPYETLNFNINSTLNIIDIIKCDSSHTKLFFAASSEMFGPVSKLPINENTRFNPLNPYALSKATSFNIILNYRKTYNLFCCSGILFNHESILRPKQFVTKKIISGALRISKGSNEKINLGNIDIKRDWGYGPDYVKAMWLMLQPDFADDFIIATNEAHSLKDFIRIVFQKLNLEWKDHVEIKDELFKTAEVMNARGDASKLKSILGWNYGLSFEQFIEKLIQDEVEIEKLKEIINNTLR